jgi:hypothetical protein
MESLSNGACSENVRKKQMRGNKKTNTFRTPQPPRMVEMQILQEQKSATWLRRAPFFCLANRKGRKKRAFRRINISEPKIILARQLYRGWQIENGKQQRTIQSLYQLWSKLNLIVASTVG